MTRHLSHRRGFSALELTIAIAIFGGVFATIAMTTLSATDGHKAGSARADLDGRTQRALNRVAARLAQAGIDELAPLPVTPAFASALTFRDPVDFQAGAVLWSEEQQIAWELEPNELDNGLDDDSDGLVDEGRVLWVQQPGAADERRWVWCRGVSELLEGETLNGVDDNGNGLVDEPGLAFDLQGSVLRIQVTLERLDGEGHPMASTAVTEIRLRN